MLREQSGRLYLFHVFNHGTYHRGQLVNKLRQSGIEKIPPKDFRFGVGRDKQTHSIVV